jgi:Kef-type K+ transport system membrane component KefB
MVVSSHVVARVLLTFGGLFLLGLVADLLGRRTCLPRVTLLLLAGVVVGPSVLDLLPVFVIEWFPALTTIALAMIGFSLGQKLTRKTYIRLGGFILRLSVSVVLVTAAVVFIALLLCGLHWKIALLLSAAATATDPAATVDVVAEGRAKGDFTDALLGIVAIDDAWGVFLFSLVLAIIEVADASSGIIAAITAGVGSIFGAVFIGVLAGLPMILLGRKAWPRDATQAEILGGVLVCAGLASLFDVSYLLAAMVQGAVVANFTKTASRSFHVVERFEWPFLIIFFLLAGSELPLNRLSEIGVIGVVYIIVRIIGRVIGGYLGGCWEPDGRRGAGLMGVALLPQAGVAIGMALLASQHFPAYSGLLLSVAIGSTIFFELFGPVATRSVLRHLGEIEKN